MGTLEGRDTVRRKCRKPKNSRNLPKVFSSPFSRPGSCSRGLLREEAEALRVYCRTTSLRTDLPTPVWLCAHYSAYPRQCPPPLPHAKNSESSWLVSSSLYSPNHTNDCPVANRISKRSAPEDLPLCIQRWGRSGIE